MPDVVAKAVTRDTLFGGRLRLGQPAKGHRSGTDAVLLAAAVPRHFAGRMFDIGAGAGAVGLGAALACPSADVTLIENDAAVAALAQANVVDNDLCARVRVAICDVLSADERRAFHGGADLVVTNPPFYRAGDVRAAPDAARSAAHVLAPGVVLADWLKACMACLAPKGTLILVLPAASVPEAVEALRPGLGDLRLLPVYPRDGEPASRVLLRGQRGRRAPFHLAPGLVLHDAAGFTPRAAALHAGAAALDW